MITGTEEIDYINAAQIRAAADTRLLKKETTLTLAQNATQIGLPAEVLRLEALFGPDGRRVESIPIVEYLKIASGSASVWNPSQLVFCAIGRTLYTWPAPASAMTLTAFYSYRPAVIDSGSTLELTGQAERLVERLASAYLLLDDGQPELAQSELSDYAKDAQRLRRQDRAAEGSGGMLAVAGRRMPLL